MLWSGPQLVRTVGRSSPVLWDDPGTVRTTTTADRRTTTSASFGDERAGAAERRRSEAVEGNAGEDDVKGEVHFHRADAEAAQEEEDHHNVITHHHDDSQDLGTGVNLKCSTFPIVESTDSTSTSLTSQNPQNQLNGKSTTPCKHVYQTSAFV